MEIYGDKSTIKNYLWKIYNSQFLFWILKNLWDKKNYILY